MVPLIKASRPGPEAAKQPQIITLPPPEVERVLKYYTNVNVPLH